MHQEVVEVNLETTYMGLKLRNPLVASASPLSREIDSLKRLEDAGASAVVLYSLFEEEMALEDRELHQKLTMGTESFAEALTYFPEPEHVFTGPELYLNHIQKAKAAVKIPIIASLNGASVGGWTSIARKMQDAGADALELNLYDVAADFDVTAEQVEARYMEVVAAVKETVTIPVAVKLSPFFTSMANMAKKLDKAGANALVLFNRFYQPDIDIEELRVEPSVLLSTPMARRLPLRWIAILHGRIQADLAATSGIHSADDVVKMIMAGAKVTMLCSTLLRNGIDKIREIESDLKKWMEKHEYDSVESMRGAVSQIACDKPAAFERAQYIQTISSYEPDRFMRVRG